MRVVVVVVGLCAIFSACAFFVCVCVYVFLTILALAFWPYSAQFEPRTRPEQAGQRNEESRVSRAEPKSNETKRIETIARRNSENRMRTFVVAVDVVVVAAVAARVAVCVRVWYVSVCVSVFAVSPFERRFIKIRFSFCALIQFVPCCRVEVAGDGRVTKINLSQNERKRKAERKTIAKANEREPRKVIIIIQIKSNKSANLLKIINNLRRLLLLRSRLRRSPVLHLCQCA